MLMRFHLPLNRRCFSSSGLKYAKYYDVFVPEKEAASSIAYPSSVKISVHRIPPSVTPPKCPHGRFTYTELKTHAEGLRKIRESSVNYHQMAQETALVEIAGPLGTGYVPVPEWIDLNVSIDSPKNDQFDMWHGLGSVGGETESSGIYADSAVIPDGSKVQLLILLFP
jgi:hypothetical protein